ncbi:MAG: RnfABCDGE type electron transport complex subunit B [Neisseriaceae bacterium]
MTQKKVLPEEIDQILPQTQCQQCGYQGCLPYAQALSVGEANINLCLPGQEEVMLDLALLLDKLPQRVPTYLNRTVYIKEEECIGCKACIRVCPVDAIVGTTKQMHTVIRQECTGCQLCVSACPVDCIYPRGENSAYLPLTPFLSSASNLRKRSSEHIRLRMKNRQLRLSRLKLKPKKTLKIVPTQQSSSDSLSPQLIDKFLLQAQQKAAQRRSQRIKINHEVHQHQNLVEEKRRSAYRKAQRDLRYGTMDQKAQALTFLKKWKEQQSQDSKENLLNLQLKAARDKNHVK